MRRFSSAKKSAMPESQPPARQYGGPHCSMFYVRMVATPAHKWLRAAANPPVPVADPNAGQRPPELAHLLGVSGLLVEAGFFGASKVAARDDPGDPALRDDRDVAVAAILHLQ